MVMHTGTFITLFLPIALTLIDYKFTEHTAHPNSSRNGNHMLANVNLFACECEQFLSLVTFACFGSHWHASV